MAPRHFVSHSRRVAAEREAFRFNKCLSFPITLFKKMRRYPIIEIEKNEEDEDIIIRPLRTKLSGERGRPWIKNIRGYTYYPLSKRIQRIIRRYPLRYKKHLCLPIPEDQGEGQTCLFHAVINATEARFRIGYWTMNHRFNMPRLSIQHAIDFTTSLNDPLHDPEELVYNFLGVEYRTDVLKISYDELGVTSAIHWPYRDPAESPDQRPKLPLSRDVREWDRNKLRDLKVLDEEGVFVREEFRFRLDNVEVVGEEIYDGTNEGIIDALITELEESGPFVAWFDVYSSHEASRKALTVLTADGQPLGSKHAVVVTGYKKKHRIVEGANVMGGYWEIMESAGPNYGRSGFCRIDFAAVSGVEIPIPLLDRDV